MKKLIAGNWKMNGRRDSAQSLIAEIEAGITADPDLLENCDFVVCPPFPHLGLVRENLRNVFLGAQDCAARPDGAFTGDVSASMLHDMACTYVIVGHSERRQHHGETDQVVAAKAELAHKEHMATIICVGETEAERAAGHAEAVVGAQLKHSLPPGTTSSNTVIAYEPVWAIGTGKTATPADIRAMHAFIRKNVTEKIAGGRNMRILYGGSVKPAGAAEIFAVEDVDGALIGGASLKAADFLGIAGAVKG